ncbi:hypothetical protein KM043_005871 [Ampulex compressa]|nr:hypothetical protein KM043_005871 [Ampulex compressa]
MAFTVQGVFRIKLQQTPPYLPCLTTLRLFSVPKGKPIITSAYNTSATSIYLAWKAPSRDTIHGEFLGYRIGYRPRDKTNMEVKDIYIRDPTVDNHSIYNLETYTQYLVSLQVFNPAGHGPASTVSVMTDEGALVPAVDKSCFRLPGLSTSDKEGTCRWERLPALAKSADSFTDAWIPTSLAGRRPLYPGREYPGTTPGCLSSVPVTPRDTQGGGVGRRGGFAGRSGGRG